MHCPNCGQHQISNETKFCSRCGLPLSLVAEVLANGGFLPQLAELNKKRSIFTKKNGVVFGAFWFIFFTMLLTSIFGIAGADELAGITAVIGVFGMLMIVIGSLVLLPSSKQNLLALPQTQLPPPHGLPGGTTSGQHAALPPQQSVPVSAYSAPQPGRWRDTNDLLPTSVTEETTRLLDDQKQQ